MVFNLNERSMKDIQSKWLGGCTAESYIAGAVGFTYRDNNGKPKYEKLHYWKWTDSGNTVVVRIPNPSAPMDEQIWESAPKKLKQSVRAMYEVQEHLGELD